MDALGRHDDGRADTRTGHRPNDRDPRSNIADTGAYICPKCGAQDLNRIPRRLIDRLLALFTGVRRFRCTHVECSWEGNLRRKKTSSRRFEP
jgi:hypothetical protein